MSDTPRTDAKIRDHVSIYENLGLTDFVDADFARQLERELAEARAEIERIDHQRRAGWTEIERLKLVSQNQETVIAAQRRSAKAKDQLIEQMRDTLKHVRLYSCSHMQRTTHDMIDAALSAAERGGKV